MKNNKPREEHYETVVVGGGPAGIMAAIAASQNGAKVVILEKNKILGKKLLITGKGRCNITQAEDNNQNFIAKLGKNGKFLFSSLSAFGPKEVIRFFEERSLSTKIERGGRVFPASDKAQDVINLLLAELQKHHVTVMYDKQVLNFFTKKGAIEYIELKDRKIYANQFIVCTGGKSYPATGSTGDGYQWISSLGHTIKPVKPALVPIKTKEPWVTKAQGLSLKNVQINIFQNNKKITDRFGEMLFTHFGLSGPIVLDASKTIGELLTKGDVEIEIDLKPALSFLLLDKRLQRDFEANKNKDFKNYLPELVPLKLVEIIPLLSGIEADRKIHSINKQERKLLVHLLKGLKVTVHSLLGFDHAIITSGGVALNEVDSKTMRSKIISNLFFAGEILDLDGPTGGYNLQICWSTGYAAGTYAAKNVLR